MSSTPCETKLLRLPPELVREVICHVAAKIDENWCGLSDSFLDLFASSLVCTTWNDEAHQRLDEFHFSHLFFICAPTRIDIKRMAELLKEAHKYGLHYHTLIKYMSIYLPTPCLPEPQFHQTLEGYATILSLCPPYLSTLAIHQGSKSGSSNKNIDAFFDHIKNLTLPTITTLQFFGSDNVHYIASFISSHSATLRRLFLRSMCLDGPMASALRLCTQLRELDLECINGVELFSLFSSWPELRSFRYGYIGKPCSATDIADELRKWCPHITDFKYGRSLGGITINVY